ncbi:MAG: zinc-binding dehydrogenase [Saprospiraceae bacterium]
MKNSKIKGIALDESLKRLIWHEFKPKCGENTALVPIRYSALNHRDVWISKGKYPGIKPFITLGSDGLVEQEGHRKVINPGLHWGNNENFQSSRFEVLGMPSHGTFADAIEIEQSKLHDTPRHLSDEEAAALPLAGLTAYRCLLKRCQLKPKEKVLITGIGGGVASMALQYAIAMDAEVIVTSGSLEKIDKALKLGAKAGYNYREEDWHNALISDFGGVDVVIDSAGGEGFANLVSIVNPGGRIGFYGGGLGNWTFVNPQKLFWRQISILGSTMGSDQDFREMLDFVSLHNIRPVVDQVFNISDYDEAFRYMSSASQFGKIVFNNLG